MSVILFVPASADTLLNYTASKGGVPNGGFETGSGSASSTWIGLENYRWYTQQSAVTGTASFNRTYYYDGSQSLKINISTTSSNGALYSSQYDLDRTVSKISKYAIPIKSNTTYRFSGWIKTEGVSNLNSKGALFIFTELTDSAYNNRIFFTPYQRGTVNWTQNITVFTTSSTTTHCEILTELEGETGAAFFDGITLEEITSSNVSQASYVRPVIQGVTSVDNIDQSLDTSGTYSMVYTVPTTISEAATDRQTFTPTKSKITRIGIWEVAAILGTQTLTVHDASNNIIASASLTNSTLTPGTFSYFNVPALWLSGNYHFHLTSDITGSTIKTNTISDMETASYIENYAKNTESVLMTLNSSTLNLNTDNADGLVSRSIINTKDGFFNYTIPFNGAENFSAIYSADAGGYSTAPVIVNGWGWTNSQDSIQSASDTTIRSVIFKINSVLPFNQVAISPTLFNNNLATGSIDISADGSTYKNIWNASASASPQTATIINTDIAGNSTIYVRLYKNATNGYVRWDNLAINGTLNTASVNSAIGNTWIIPTGVNYFNISSNGIANSSSLDPSLQANVWLYSISASVKPIVLWYFNQYTIVFPGRVTGNDTSLNTPTAWCWTMGDGSVPGNTQNITYQYVKRGLWNASLNVSNSAGYNESFHLVRVIGYSGVASQKQPYTTSRFLDNRERLMTECKLFGLCDY